MIYSDPSDPSKIGLDGVEKLCNDLELDPVSGTQETKVLEVVFSVLSQSSFFVGD